MCATGCRTAGMPSIGPRCHHSVFAIAASLVTEWLTPLHCAADSGRSAYRADALPALCGQRCKPIGSELYPPPRRIGESLGKVCTRREIELRDLASGGVLATFTQSICY